MIKRNVTKLRLLADRIEQVNSSLSLTVAESHALLASRQTLDHHMANLDFEAGMDVHSQYLEALEELVLAEELLCSDLLRRGESLAGEAETVFHVSGGAGGREEAEDGLDREKTVVSILRGRSLAGNLLLYYIGWSHSTKVILPVSS